MGIHLGLCRRRAAVTPSSPGQLPGGGGGAGNARPRRRASSLPDEAQEQRRGLTGRVQELRVQVGVLGYLCLPHCAFSTEMIPVPISQAATCLDLPCVDHLRKTVRELLLTFCVRKSCGKQEVSHFCTNKTRQTFSVDNFTPRWSGKNRNGVIPRCTEATVSRTDIKFSGFC